MDIEVSRYDIQTDGGTMKRYAGVWLRVLFLCNIWGDVKILSLLFAGVRSWWCKNGWGTSEATSQYCHIHTNRSVHVLCICGDSNDVMMHLHIKKHQLALVSMDLSSYHGMIEVLGAVASWSRQEWRLRCGAVSSDTMATSSLMNVKRYFIWRCILATWSFDGWHSVLFTTNVLHIRFNSQTNGLM